MNMQRYSCCYRLRPDFMEKITSYDASDVASVQQHPLCVTVSHIFVSFCSRNQVVASEV
jgi:hypothetical protein